MSATAREQINTACTTAFCVLLLSAAGLLLSGVLDGSMVPGAEYLTRFENEVAAWLASGIP